MPHRARRPLVVLLFGFLTLPAAVLAGPVPVPGPSPQAAGRYATGAVTIRADLSSHTSLRISSADLRFEVSEPGKAVRTAIDFTAAARTEVGGDVVLTIEPDGAVEAPANVQAVALAVALAGDGGTLGTEPRVAGKWSGSGVRHGRLEFTLSGAPAPGVYRVPVKFVLSAP